MRAALFILMLSAAVHADDDPPEPAQVTDEDEAGNATPAPPPPPPDAKHIAELTKSILADPRYRFCHADEFPLWPDEAEWCPLAEKMQDRCPSLKKACAALVVKDSEWHAPKLGSLPRILLFIILAAVLLWLAIKVGRHFVIARASNVAIGGETVATLEPAELQVQTVESDVERLLQLAQSAAADGRHAQAIDHAYAALLRRLEGEGLIRVEKWRTNGDYLRDLREKPDLRDQVRAVVREVEAVQFGVTPPSADSFQSLFARIRPLVQGVLLLALMMLVGACGARRGSAADSPTGMSAVRSLWSQAGVPVEHRLKAIDRMEGFEGAVVLLAEPQPAEWDLLLDWVKRGGGLVIAGEMPLPKNLGIKRGSRGQPVTLRVAEDMRQSFGDVQVSLPTLPCLEGGDPILKSGNCAYATALKSDKGLIIALADAQLFQNASLAAADNGAFLVGMLEFIRRPGDVQLVDEMTGQSSPSPFASLARAGLSILMLQVSLLVVLWFWHRGKAFGRLREPPPAPRRAFVEHVRALGAQYAKARALSHVMTAIDQLSRTGGRK